MVSEEPSDFITWGKTLDLLDKLIEEIERVDKEEIKAMDYKALKTTLAIDKNRGYDNKTLEALK